jgi:glycosyltransferase involved in cell wall biosynthesis
MTRVLHVLGRDEDLQTRVSLRTLREQLSPRDVEQHVHALGSAPLWAALRLRREMGAFDVVHAWDERAFAAAALAGARRVVFSTSTKLGRRTIHRVNRALDSREVDLVCTNEATQRRYVTAGVPPGRCHVVRPPIDPRGFDASARAAAREALGLAEDDYVLLAPGESTRAAAHERAVWAGSILHVVDERYRVLLWGRGSRLPIAAGLGDKLRQKGLVVVAERVLRRRVEFHELLPAADAMLVASDQPGGNPTPLAMAMAAGVPVVGVASAELSDLMTDRTTALTVPAFAPRPVAQLVLELRANSDLRRSIISHARRTAAQVFSADRFVAEVSRLYGVRAEPPAAQAPFVGT